MADFDGLPKSTKVSKVIPKNAFESYASPSVKKLFTEKIEKIRWTHKLAFETTNLPSKEIKEIQFFEIELREQDKIEEVIKTIDRAIPYPILFKLKFEEKERFVVSKKHANPNNEDNAVIDWTFDSGWKPKGHPIELVLKESIDEVFRKLCISVSGSISSRTESIDSVVERSRKISQIESEIIKLKAKISKEKQFNRKVEMNNELQLLLLNHKDLNNTES